MEPIYSSYFPYRSHPGGDDISPRLLSIIRIARSNAGYNNYGYPHISDVPHRGTLTRPETLASPVYLAYRQRHNERLRSLPSFNKASLPTGSTVPLVVAMGSNHRDGTPVHMSVGFLPESGLNDCVPNPLSTHIPVNTTAEETEPKNAIAECSVASNSRGRSVRNRISLWFSRPHSHFLKSFRHKDKKITRHCSENEGVKGLDESKNGQEDEKTQETDKAKETQVKVMQANLSDTPRCRGALSRVARRLQRQFRKIFN